MALLKNYFGGAEQDAPILYEINAEMVQMHAEANVGRLLTGNELERVFYAMIEGDRPSWLMLEFIMSAVEEALDEEKNDWSGVDKDYAERKHKYYIGEYSVGEDEKPEKLCTNGN